MDLIQIRALSLLGILTVGLLATVGIFVLTLLVTAVVQGGFAIAGGVGRLWSHATSPRGPEVGTTGAKAVAESLQLDAATHALLAWQAWWRLRC